jgi:hypothetical protein
MCAFGLVVVGALSNLAKDLPWLLGDKMTHRGALDQSWSMAAALV